MKLLEFSNEKNTDNKAGQALFGKVHLQPHSAVGKWLSTFVSIAYQKYPDASRIIGISNGKYLIRINNPTIPIMLKHKIGLLITYAIFFSTRSNVG